MDLSLQLSPPQMGFLTSNAKNRAFIGGIGSGKTFAGALEVLRAPAGSLGMVVAPTYPMLRDSSQRTFFELYGDAIESHNKAENSTRLVNGTEILWRSAEHPDRLRGPNLAWAWGDEWAFVSLEAHRVLQGRLRVGAGRLWVTTTPNGFNYLYREVVDGPTAPLWDGFYAGTASNIHLPPEYIETLRASFEGDLAAQELDGQFVDVSGSKRIPAGLVGRCYDDIAPEDAPISHGIYQCFCPPSPYARYVIGADPAEGLETGDDSAFVVLRADTGDVVASGAAKWSPEHFARVLEEVSRFYNNARCLIERNNHGHAVILASRALNVSVVVGPDGRPGWPQTGPAKANLWIDAHRACLEGGMHAGDNGPWRIRGRRLKEQISAIDRDTLAHPEKGKRKAVDDLAMAWALAVQQVTRSNNAATAARPGRGAKPAITQRRTT